MKLETVKLETVKNSHYLIFVCAFGGDVPGYFDWEDVYSRPPRFRRP